MTKLSLVSILESAGGTFVGYHATRKRMDRPEKFLMKTTDFGPGFYFATDVRDTLTYGEVIYQAQIVLKNPIVISRTTPPDPVFVAKMQKALKITDQDLSYGDHPIVEIFTLANTIISMGDFTIQAFQNFLVKLGYDGVIVSKDVLKQKQNGDYIVVFTPQQIVSWEIYDQAKTQEMLIRQYSRT
jgi:hypothetical protein